MNRLGAHSFLHGSCRGDVGSADRIFLEFAAERNLIGGTRGGCSHALLESIAETTRHDSHDRLQHGNQDDGEEKIKDEAKHLAVSIVANAQSVPGQTNILQFRRRVIFQVSIKPIEHARQYVASMLFFARTVRFPWIND